MDNLIATIKESLKKLCLTIGKIAIGNKSQFPYGWRNAAKGRTVWRIIEEIVIQNLKKSAFEFGLSNVEFASSDIDVYDFKCNVHESTVYVNIKSAVLEGKTNKDDISKALGLKTFLEEDINRNLIVATFYIKFNEVEEMSVEIDDVTVFPVAWIPDVYVNPSNNGNLQSSKYKNLSDATKRTNEEFYALLVEQIDIANKKKRNKQAQKD